MRYPNPLAHITGEVTAVRQIATQSGDVFAYGISVVTEPNGGLVEIAAPEREFDRAQLEPLVGTVASFEVALGARADSRDNVNRAYVRATLGRVLDAPLFATA